MRSLAIENVQVGHFSNWRAASQVAAQPHGWPGRVYLVHQLPTTQPNDLPTDRSTRKIYNEKPMRLDAQQLAIQKINMQTESKPKVTNATTNWIYSKNAWV